MKILFATMLASVILTLFLGLTVEARTVYLKDGAVLKADSVWRKGGNVWVLVNRDVLLTFTLDEVNLKKTFPRKGVSRRDRTARTTAGTRTPVMAPMTSAQQNRNKGGAAM